MPDYCFGLKNGFCDVLKDPHCPGYDVCPFYKPKSVNDAEIKRYGGFNQYSRITDEEKQEIAKLREQKKTISQIAKETMLTESAIARYIREELKK